MFDSSKECETEEEIDRNMENLVDYTIRIINCMENFPTGINDHVALIFLAKTAVSVDRLFNNQNCTSSLALFASEYEPVYLGYIQKVREALEGPKVKK